MISIWEGAETRKHNQLSVRPQLGIFYNAIKDNFGYVESNHGLGPAIITARRIFIDGHEINYTSFSGYDEFINKLGLQGRLRSLSPLDSGTTIKSGSSKAMIIFKI